MIGRRKRSVLVVERPGAGPAAQPGAAADEFATFDPAERGEWWWRQPKWSRQEWTFEAGGRIVGTLRGGWFFSSVTRARFAGAAYDVRRGWTGNFEARPEGGSEPLARYVARWTGGGRVEGPPGGPLELVPTGIWGRTHELRTTDQLLLLRFESHDGLFRHHVRIHPADAARRRADLPLLLALAGAVVFAPKYHSYPH